MVVSDVCIVCFGEQNLNNIGLLFLIKVLYVLLVNRLVGNYVLRYFRIYCVYIWLLGLYVFFFCLNQTVSVFRGVIFNVLWYVLCSYLVYMNVLMRFIYLELLFLIDSFIFK